MKKTNIKILHVIPAFTYGIASYLKGLIQGADSDKILFDVVGFGKIPQEFEDLVISKGGRCCQLPSIHKEPFRMISMLFQTIRQNQYDVLHCHIYGYRGLPFKATARISGVKDIIIHAHSSDEENKGKFEGIQKRVNRICNRTFVNHFFACSTMAAEYQYGKDFCRNHKIVIMPNSVDTRNFCHDMNEEEKRQYYNELGVSPEDMILIHIGRFNNPKNHMFLIDIIKEIKNNIPNFVTLFVGTGELQGAVREKVMKNNLEKNVRFLNERNDVAKLLQLADIFMLPSFFEGLPVVGIEAQAAGVPLLVSNRVTPEVDMGMGLVEFLPIDEGAANWREAVCRLGKNKRKISPKERETILEGNGFTIQGLWKKYYKEVMSF